jgi:hypothetical protein
MYTHETACHVQETLVSFLKATNLGALKSQRTYLGHRPIFARTAGSVYAYLHYTLYNVYIFPIYNAFVYVPRSSSHLRSHSRVSTVSAKHATSAPPPVVEVAGVEPTGPSLLTGAYLSSRPSITYQAHRWEQIRSGVIMRGWDPEGG